MRVPACLLHVKLKKLACIAWTFDMCMIASEYTRHTSDVRHGLSLGLPPAHVVYRYSKYARSRFYKSLNDQKSEVQTILVFAWVLGHK